MYRMKVDYVDYNGEARNETLFFNLNQAEIAEMSVSEEGGLDKKIIEIFNTKDRKELIRIIKSIVLKAYGVKSTDGKTFRKSDAMREDFENSAAYPVVFMKLATDDKIAAEFMNNVVPQVAEADRRQIIAKMDVDEDVKKELLDATGS